jgi:hypothetical protein
VRSILLVQPSERESDDHFYLINKQVTEVSRSKVSKRLDKMDRIAKKQEKKTQGRIKYWTTWHHIIMECPSHRPGQVSKIDSVLVFMSRRPRGRRSRSLRRVFEKLQEDSRLIIAPDTVDELCSMIAQGGQ